MKHGNWLAQRKTKMERLTWITLVTIVWEEGIISLNEPSKGISRRRGVAHTDPGELKNMRNSITFEFMQWYDSIWRKIDISLIAMYN